MGRLIRWPVPEISKVDRRCHINGDPPSGFSTQGPDEVIGLLPTSGRA
ncbi:hypothetical protein [Calidifontibacter indicus]